MALKECVSQVHGLRLVHDSLLDQWKLGQACNALALGGPILLPGSDGENVQRVRLVLHVRDNNAAGIGGKRRVTSPIRADRVLGEGNWLGRLW